MSRLRRALVAVALAAAVSAACSGGSDAGFSEPGPLPAGSGGSSGTSAFGGSGGQGGSPDVLVAGGAGTAGSAGVSQADAAADVSTGPGAGSIRCGERQCERAQGQLCCATQPLVGSVTFECRASAGGCTVSYECDGDEDCAGGVCCGTRGALGQWAGFVCQSSCDSGALPAGCRSAANCPSGSVCCGTRTGGAFDSYVKVECSETCDGNQQTVLCGSEAECMPGRNCVQSTILPAGFTVCG